MKLHITTLPILCHLLYTPSFSVNEQVTWRAKYKFHALLATRTCQLISHPYLCVKEGRIVISWKQVFHLENFPDW